MVRVFYYSLFSPSLLLWKHKDQISDTKLPSQRSHIPISSCINSTCLHRAVVTLSVLGEIRLLCTCWSIRMLHFLALSSPLLCCWKCMIPAGKGPVSRWERRSAILIDNCGDEPWLFTGSWLSSLDIPIFMTWETTRSPFPSNISRPFQGRPAGRNTQVGCSRHSIAPLSNTQFTVWGIFRALRKVFAGWQSD